LPVVSNLNNQLFNPLALAATLQKKALAAKSLGYNRLKNDETKTGPGFID
jgi:hypothetical protein